MTKRSGWREALRVVVLTDGQADASRIERRIGELIERGVRTFILREPQLSAAALCAICERIMPTVEANAGLLLVNDRVDVAAAAPCHGVHLKQASLDVASARRLLPAGRLISVSVHDEAEIRNAAGADWLLLSPVFPTPSKPRSAGLGVERAVALSAREAVPVVWLGGLDSETCRAVERRAHGLATLRGFDDAALIDALVAWGRAHDL